MNESKQIERGLHEEPVKYCVSMPSPQLTQQAALNVPIMCLARTPSGIGYNIIKCDDQNQYSDIKVFEYKHIIHLVLENVFPGEHYY